MAGLGGVFGAGTVANQLLVWGVLNQVLGSALSPATVEIQNLVNEAFPNVALPVGSAADAVARKLTDKGHGEGEAKKQGIDTDVFATLTELASHAPDMSVIAEAVRRKLIDIGGDDPRSATFNGALTDAGIRPEWHPIMAKLLTQIPSVAEVMNAWLRGQIEEGEAHERYLLAGGDPTWFQTSYNAQGEAPTPVQALELLNRGIIGESGRGPGSTSYEQAFLEGPWRNKWLPAFLALRRYLPPPRTVTAMYREGSIDHARAAQLLAWQGLEAGDIAAYLAAGQKTKHTTERHLAKSEILALYHDRLIDKSAAEASLLALGYVKHDADELVALTDVKLATSQTNAAINRVRTLYLGAKLDRAAALKTLTTLGVPAVQAGQVLDIWTLEHRKTVRLLTPAQIVSAWAYGLLTQADAVTRLEADGYGHDDALILLALHGKGPLAGAAPGTPGGKARG